MKIAAVAVMTELDANDVQGIKHGACNQSAEARVFEAVAGMLMHAHRHESDKRPNICMAEVPSSVFICWQQ